ncbi:14-3-3 domain-containing protein [Ilyonectria robusta]|uniref:14-3-3 domain-containing protein n=1 Tax=Ilyonectria robusta TaxID=1079257 RepID=UPI001E8D5D70|nr:14-3-3 domain-containing protein [Ilyonectria robusta]KAH8647508.1 14-3-3 domain-containing protein [Ilyonectria robusta]
MPCPDCYYKYLRSRNDNRGKQAFLARLCEQAGRYDDTVTHVNEVAKAGGEFSSEEQKLLSTAYRNVVGSRRASLQIISSSEESESSSEKYATAI